ncbi:MAG: hypothetical protein BWK80_33435 [Desulfobacteraceae bacterium IS3]|nr:MAG: hypothetical protein BWK80_33435 [Desulfobacteraceae bacterium IS3]
MFFQKKNQNKAPDDKFRNALLKVRFYDFQEQMTVTVNNLSEQGATLYSDRVFLKGRHLIARDQKPELNLEIISPEGVFESPVEICWYRWLVEKNLFEIGIKFIKMWQNSLTKVFI